MPESILQLFRIGSRTALAVFCALILFSNTASAAPDGKALFQSNCASCHNPLKDATGPALKGINATFPSKEWGYNWVHNSAALIAAGDKDAVAIYTKFNKAAMTAFPQLKNEEIDAIFAYVNSVEPPKDPGADKQAAGSTSESSEGSGYLYTIITLSLLVLVIILWRANQSLGRAANEKEGIVNEKEVPLYRNKVVIAIVAILAFIMAGYWLVNGAINEGRQQNYRPLQPIFYSHRVHAGINQINCLYCHSSAEKSKHSMIPSSNVCMNCHKQIAEYTGKEVLKTAEGKTVNGTEEIKKLYAYAGWDAAAKKYKLKADGSIDATPIQWTKIHNLPDHVYFNHAQHVKVGQIQCQRCHGPIQEMDEVYQFAPLSMGWCINCHRQTQVQMDNDYYSIFQKYRDEIKAGKRTGVTEAEMGGTECQKCHY